ncbi:AI-2E family transporter [Microbulbifer thermotolerans]|uniref:AI-2E family transporter n=1 Tax=Microbulbifer thermotolerans TaxID=252514 RepID=A0A143HQJ0_MICTH|nr:AI-2E family transporter [Microbulbifer thermotolerans]AMX03761.1 AI-2E family transporter [Microbulbifer thermotolerans]MCX2780702.1 AI-2E family transporter [Microbulbifer thermotolerans]MCX2783572.1 AI-2E family transporter [Microbulbifer thermotolerans]MCX2795783.1 AI-2E family transporter [Microbulbifer thermotolerans]MCX2801947.1 AI-2E family transporter [Microbulbifer thermotolerans]
MHEKLERRSFILALLLVTLAFTLLLKPFFTPIFWACAIALIFFPVYRYLIGRFPRWPNLMALLTLLLCIVLVVIPVLAVASSFINQAATFYQKIQSGQIDLSQQIEQVRNAFPGINAALERTGLDLEQVKQRLLGGLMNAGSFLAKNALALGQNTLNFFVMLGLMTYLTFFLLRDGEKLVDLLIRALPLGDEREHLLLAKFAEVTRATIKGNLVVAVTQGTLGGLIFWILGLPAPLLWGVLMTLLSLLPAIGAALIWFPAAIYLYAIGDIVKASILMLFGFVVISLVDNLLRPILVGRDTKLPDYIVLFSTVGGLMMFGISGFAIGPLLAALFMAFWEIFMREFVSTSGGAAT